MANVKSGIPASEELRAAFFDCNQSGSSRFITAQIEDEEEIKLMKVVKGTNDWRNDLDLVPNELDAKTPCYVLFRTDNKTALGYGWLFFAYVPDSAKVRAKMTYASSRQTVRLACGGNFDGEIFGSSAREFSRQGFEEWEAHKAAPAPLTESEEIHQSSEYNSVLDAVAYASAGTTSMVHGVAFEPEQNALNALQTLAKGGHNYVRLGLDLENEKIIFVEKGDININDIEKKIPLDTAAFHFFRYDHTFMGENISPIIYIYNCPDGSGNTRSAPVKMRMLYSSSKGAAEELIERFGKKAELRIEINEPADVSSELIVSKLHPINEEKKGGFSKPKPVGRGNKRLIK